jgi:hypothetical protein
MGKEVASRSKYDLTNMRAGSLLVLRPAGTDGGGHATWQCRCDCGKDHITTASRLRSGEVKSCGCQRKTLIGNALRTHGRSKRGGGEYKIWCCIIERCENTEHPGYRNYGGRGIRMCERWRHDFPAFLADVGPRPSPQHSIDRINGDGDYKPGNVRWATSKQQNRNRRDVRLFTFENHTACMTEWSERLGVPYQRLYNRLVRKGEPAAQVLAEGSRVKFRRHDL